MKVGNLLDQFIPPKAEIDQSFAHGRVFGIHETLFNKLQQAGNGCLGFFLVRTKLAQVLLVATFPVESSLEVGLQHCLETIRLEDLLGEFAHDDVIELVHWHAKANAGGDALLEASRAAIVAVLATLACVLDQCGATMTAARYPG